nr:HepT-like ribonuclease domain-containing protein [Lacrimispora amygdalina]
MDNIKNDHYYIQKLQQDLTFIATHMRNVDIEELGKNEILQDSMLFRMIQISENAKKLTEEYKMEHAGIPWKAIYGLRNRIVHDYGNVDLEVVYETLKNDIPELLEMVSME